MGGQTNVSRSWMFVSRSCMFVPYYTRIIVEPRPPRLRYAEYRSLPPRLLGGAAAEDPTHCNCRSVLPLTVTYITGLNPCPFFLHHLSPNLSHAEQMCHRHNP